jgi:hypothetical protein
VAVSAYRGQCMVAGPLQVLRADIRDALSKCRDLSKIFHGDVFKWLWSDGW